MIAKSNQHWTWGTSLHPWLRNTKDASVQQVLPTLWFSNFVIFQRCVWFSAFQCTNFTFSRLCYFAIMWRSQMIVTTHSFCMLKANLLHQVLDAGQMITRISDECLCSFWINNLIFKVCWRPKLEWEIRWFLITPLDCFQRLVFLMFCGCDLRCWINHV